MLEDYRSDHIRILAIDEDQSTLDLYQQAISSDLVFCQQGNEAITLVKNALEEHHPFAIVFLGGQRLAEPERSRIVKQLRVLDSDVELVMVTEDVHWPPDDTAIQISVEHKLLSLVKPFHAQQVAQLVLVLGAKWLTECKLQAMRDELQQERQKCQRDQERLHQLERAVEMMQLGIMITDLDGNILYTNPAVAEMHGYQKEELFGQEMIRILAPALRKSPTLSQLKSWNGLIRESLHLKKDGTVFPVWLMSEIVQNAEGEPWAMITSCEDITERKHTEEELKRHREHLEELIKDRTTELRRTNAQLQQEILEHTWTTEALQKSEERYRTVLEAAPDPVIVYDMEEHVTYLNPAFSRIFGWTRDESQAQHIDFVPVELLSESRLIFTKIRQGEIVSGVETCRLTKDGTSVEVSISGAGFFDTHGILQGNVITIQDITERKKTEQEIRFIAYHDALTGLHNRKSFYMRLEDKLLQFHHKGEEKRRVGDKWALMFLDLDNFKCINDTLGHDVGDELLKLVADRLQLCIRKSDYLFRLGGDEFTILLNDLNDDTDVAKVVQKIREEIARPCYIKHHELYISISIGISIYPTDGQDVETLVKNADMAMYAAKEENEGYRFFTEEMNQKALERMRLESSLRSALQQNQFIIHYQPLMDAKNRIGGMEALVRWCHPELGLINPSRFIPLAEETGIIVPLGKWVLHTACQQTKQWHDMGYPELYVAVNLSTRQFKETDLVETIEQVLEVTGLPPTSLKLEVTETGIMDDPEYAVKVMQLLRAKGIQFSIDDFGTGYSSLGYLKRFPVDTLKIDRSFILNSLHNKEDQEIIKTIISMAHMLKMKTVAEGVETQEQYEFLLRQGCQMMQGYYLGWPVPADQFGEMLQRKESPEKKESEQTSTKLLKDLRHK